MLVIIQVCYILHGFIQMASHYMQLEIFFSLKIMFMRCIHVDTCNSNSSILICCIVFHCMNKNNYLPTLLFTGTEAA